MVREVAVIGLGRFGTAVALTLAEAGCAVVGIDRDRALVQELAEQLDDVVQADATDDAALRQLGITDFDVVVVAIGADFESNLLIATSLKELGVRHIIAKALSARQAAILHKIGANQVVLPEQEAGQRLANRLLAPNVTDALRTQTGIPALEVDLPDAWNHRTLHQLRLPQQYGVQVIAVRRAGDLVVVPDPDTPLASCERIVVVGPGERLRSFARFLQQEHSIVANQPS
jgi:trk system potassium uptake protein TrkA